MNNKIRRNIFAIMGLILIVSLISFVYAQNSTNSSEFVGAGVVVGVNVSLDNSSINHEVSIINFFPKEVKVGDVQFNIQVLNNGNNSLSNVIALVSGNGFSTYDVFPIDSLSSGEKDYIFVSGNFNHAGNITLNIKIGNDVFYQNVNVVSQDLSEQEKADAQRKDILLNISLSLQDLEQEYNALEDEVSAKSNANYDVSKVNLDDLRKFLRDAQANILSENIGEAKNNLNLAEQEYLDQKNILDNAQIIPLIQRTKDYAVIFSAIAGAFLMFFTLAEMLRRKGEGIFSVFSRRKDNVKKKKR